MMNTLEFVNKVLESNHYLEKKMMTLGISECDMLKLKELNNEMRSFIS